MRQLPALLEQGPQAFGYWEDVWTRERVATVIENRFGVKYSLSQVGRILHKIGWTPQKPLRQAAERDEVAIEQWKKEEWPSLKKSG